MTLDQLRVFLAVAEREHVTEAARVLNLTQSAVSHAISMLEAGCGLSLFSRIGRRIELTDAGRLLQVEAQAVIARMAALKARMADFAGLGSGVLNLHASQTIAGYWLPGRLMAFRALHPGVELRMQAGNTAEVCRSVREGHATLGLIEGEVDLSDLRCETVALDRLLLVVAPFHPWKNTPPQTVPELVGSDWILRETGSGTRGVLENVLRGSGMTVGDLSVLMEFSSNEAVRAAVEAGGAATVLSASVVAGSLEAGILHAVPFLLPERRYVLVSCPQRDPGPSGAAFAAFLTGGG
ncbi:LysR substrate-binding domain-containing protein [Gluconobacter wancherniae]|uniref:LysR family transcriptional regulator n=1 Tax=Gluconobacter wancherniae TaxID=1307955 RepID=UPI00309758C4